MENLKPSPRPGKLVSICMPVYNGADLLPATLQMLLKQDYLNLEIIVRDDASTDATPEILSDFARLDSRIRVVRNSKNIGMWKNLIAAFDEARGEYWMIAAHDDLFAPSLVSALVDELEANPYAAMAFCEIGVVDYDGHLVESKYENLPASFYSLGKEAMYRFYLNPSSKIDGTLNSALFRRAALERAFHYVRSQRKVAGGIDGIVPLQCLREGDLVIRHERLFFRRMKKKQPITPLDWRTFPISKTPMVLIRSVISAGSYQFNHWYHIRKSVPLRDLRFRTRVWIEWRLWVIHFRKFTSVLLFLGKENLRKTVAGVPLRGG